jgi:hypothetical protein
MSYNKWGYVYSNPVNLTDPSGYDSSWDECSNVGDPVCIEKVQTLQKRGLNIKEMVRVGGLLPVEGLAQYVDYAQTLFNSNIRGMMWALTLTISGMDSERGPITLQWTSPYTDYWLGYDWLPYKHNPYYDKKNWNGSGTWIHSRRGDWDVKYWDKTANQAYHFWYFAATTFFNTDKDAIYANWSHESGFYTGGIEKIQFFPEWVAPPPSGNTQQDWDLSYAGMDFGNVLLADYDIYNTYFGGVCSSNTNLNQLFNHIAYVRPSAWIRSKLKGQVY